MDVVVGIGDAHDGRAGYAVDDGVGAGAALLRVESNPRGPSLGVVGEEAAPVVRAGEDGEDGNVDRGVALDAEVERGIDGRAGREGRHGLEGLVVLVEDFCKAVERGFEVTQLLLFVDAAGFDLVDARFGVVHLDLELRVGGIVEGAAGGGIEVDEPGDFLREAAADGAEFFACHRMADEHGPLDMECFHDGENVVAAAVGGIISVRGHGFAGGAKASAGDAIDVILAGESRGKLVEAVGRVSVAGEEDKGATGASPVEDLELHSGLDGDHLQFGRGRGLRGGEGGSQEERCEGKA